MFNLQLEIPGTNRVIRQGNVIKIGRFNSDRWTVCFGWYSWGGNRPVCGWYVERESDREIKPLYQTDLDDCYMIES